MILWFGGVGMVLVWAVFKSPGLDYRLVALGALLPIGEVVVGGARILHTLVFGVALLLVLVLATRRRRLLRRRLISLPIGVLMHLVLGGIWTVPEVFWWPFFGAGFESTPLPALDRPLAVILALDAVGVGCLVWWWRRFDLADRDNRAYFFRTGHLPRVTV